MTKSDRTLQKKQDIVSETIAAIVGTNTFTAAAENLHIDRTTLYWRLDNYPEIRASVAKMTELALDNLKRGSVRASEVMIEKLEDKDMALDAAKEVLDRVGVTSKNVTTAIQFNNVGGEMGIVVKEYKEGE